ncbi:hypothetical protein JVT61DRAFT_8293 [Boletus reticuloceps]|uniref:Uncharacterized protein n=1 Tax=Boletus reticuloceps TaxID=495285 RepID=A0A8I2YYV7_9AGAM|nr:hypothetical protein JVT61DRAFT_8293 [Boletus reticuloceps]
MAFACMGPYGGHCPQVLFLSSHDLSNGMPTFELLESTSLTICTDQSSHRPHAVRSADTGLSQKHLEYDFSIDGSRELILAGFILAYILLASPRHSITYKECGSHSVWEETECNLSLYAGLSLSDPKGQVFVNACIRHPDLMAMLRKGANARVIRSSSVVWTSRRRHARSRSALAGMPWEKTTDVASLSDSALEDAQPSGWARTKIADCMQVVVVDTGKGTMSDFVRQVYRVGNKAELYDALKGPYEAAGELEAFKEVTPEIVLDNYYPSLWGDSFGANAS